MRVRKPVIIFCALLMALFLHPSQTVFHASQNATVEGRITAGGRPIPGATVRLLNQFTAFSQVQTTDSEGKYVFNNVPATNVEEGEYYDLSVEMSGYERATRKVIISVGEEKLVIPSIALTQFHPVEALPPSTPPAKGEQTTTNAKPPSEPSNVHVEAPPEKIVPPKPPVTPPATANSTPPQPPPSRPGKMVTATATAEEPTITPDVSTTLGGVIDSRSMRALPLADRDFLDLALLAPGTYPVEQGSALEGASLVVNGIRANMNNFLLDGTDNNDYTINQSLPFQIVEAMQEFRVQASTSPAEFGRSAGAQINSISRRGLNNIHGGLFEFNRNSGLSANQFLSVYNGGTFDEYVRSSQELSFGNPLSDPKLAALYNRRDPLLVQNQFGANVGGPLRKDKLFGFFNWESFRVSNPRPLFERVPSTVVRSSTACPVFLGITPGQCDPAVLALFSLYPAPNVPTSINDPVTGLPFTDQNLGPAFFNGESANSTASDNYLGRIDWRESDRASISFKYNAQQIDEIQGGTVPASSKYPGNGTELSGRNQNFSFNQVLQLTPHLSNELRLGWNRFRLDSLAQDRSVDPASFGLATVNFHNRGLPTIFFGRGSQFQGVPFPPYAGLGADLASPSARADNVWSATDNLSYTHGQHNLKFGGEFRYVRLDVNNQAFGRGILSFNTGGFAAATGIPDLASIAGVDPLFAGGFDRDFRSKSYDWFVQDHWRLRPNFSFDLGLRYEANTAPTELRNRLVNYYPAFGGLMRAGSTTIYDPFLGDNPIGKAPSPAPRAGFNTDWNNYGPRLGFAWDPWNDGKTVVRGGYALMFDQQSMEPSVNMLLNPPFVSQEFTFLDVGINSFCGVEQAFGNFTSTCGWLTLPYSITARDPNTRTPYVHQFNFGIQRQLGNKGVAEVSYVGSAGHKLPRLRDMSPCTNSVFVASPFACFFNSFGSSPFDFTKIINQENSANSDFHSLLARLETRSFHGLQLQTHYQYAKSIDDASSMLPSVYLLSPSNSNLFIAVSGPSLGLPLISPADFAAASNASPTESLRPTLPVITTALRLPQDSSNLRGERARSDFDITHRWVTSLIYDVPRWDRARRMGNGWQMAAIATVQGGQPFSVFTDYYGTPLRPNIVGGSHSNNNDPNAAINGGLAITDPLSIFNPGPNFLLKPGSLGRNTFTGPGMRNLDFSIMKNTSFGAGERKSLQFRIELFNATNTANFRQPYSKAGELYYNLANFSTAPTTVIPDAFFGKILQARPAFAAQLALKFNF